MSTVRSVLGDIHPAELGPTYMHEHLIIDHPLVEDRFPHIHLPSVEEAVGEVAMCAAAGVRTMVDTMPCAAGRNITKLAEVSRRSGVNIVSSTGLHAARYYPGSPWATELEAEALADLFVADIEVGIDRFDYSGPVVRRTPHRAGIVKVATTGDSPTPTEARSIEAAALAHRRTGCPMITHCENGRGAPSQVRALAELGVDAAGVVLSHTDKVRDLSYHRDLLAMGVNLEYDQALRQALVSDHWTVSLIEEMASEGHLDRLMVGTDGARRSLWAELGGRPGLAHLAQLLEGTLDPAICRALLVTNPARFLAF